MTDNITVSREQAMEIFKALNGIGELLKTLPSKPENAAPLPAFRTRNRRGHQCSLSCLYFSYGLTTARTARRSSLVSTGRAPA